jgi:hypothetical protein
VTATRSQSSSPDARHAKQKALVFGVVGVLLGVLLLALFGHPSIDESTRSSLELLARTHSGTRTALGWPDAPALIVVGGCAGVLAGMLGMGGGVLKVAGMLVFFQLDVLLARAVSLATMFVATASALHVHARMGNVGWSTVRPMFVPALVGVLAGILLGTVVPKPTLTHFFAFFVLFLAFSTLAQSFAVLGAEPAGREPDRARSGGIHLAAASIGGLHGFVSGLLGISGGVVAIPMQQSLIDVPVRQAVANSIVLSALITGFGSVAAILSGLHRGDFLATEVVFASGCIGGGAWAGSHLGARVSGTIPSFYLKLLLVLVSLIAGLVILFK